MKSIITDMCVLVAVWLCGCGCGSGSGCVSVCLCVCVSVWLCVPLWLWLCVLDTCSLHSHACLSTSVPGIRTQIPGVIQYPLNAGSVKFTKGLLNMMYGASPLDNLRGIMGLITARRTAAPASAQDKKQA